MERAELFLEDAISQFVQVYKLPPTYVYELFTFSKQQTAPMVAFYYILSGNLKEVDTRASVLVTGEAKYKRF